MTAPQTRLDSLEKFGYIGVEAWAMRLAGDA